METNAKEIDIPYKRTFHKKQVLPNFKMPVHVENCKSNKKFNVSCQCSVLLTGWEITNFSGADLFLVDLELWRYEIFRTHSKMLHYTKYHILMCKTQWEWLWRLKIKNMKCIRKLLPEAVLKLRNVLSDKRYKYILRVVLLLVYKEVSGRPCSEQTKRIAT